MYTQKFGAFPIDKHGPYYAVGLRYSVYAVDREGRKLLGNAVGHCTTDETANAVAEALSGSTRLLGVLGGLGDALPVCGALARVLVTIRPR